MEVIIKKISLSASSNICILPKNVFKDLKLSTEIPYTIHFGFSTTTALVGFLDSENRGIYFTDGIFEQLNLLQDTTVNIWKTDKDIFIGPIVGLLAGCNFMTHAVAMKESTYLYTKNHIEAGLAENCLNYFFCIDDVDFLGNRIKGFTFIPELNKYDYCWFPLPDVVYAKNISFTNKIKELIKSFKKNYNIQLINNCNMLGKWELCEVLYRYPEARKYVPETIVYRNFDDALSMLNKHGFIFIKAFYGQKGKEVLSIEKINDKYKLNYYNDNAKENILDNIEELKIFVTKYAGKSKFIVQQGIRLLKYKNRTIDLRMLMMKDQYGKWESIYKVVRMAKENFNITTAIGKRITVYEKIYDYLQEVYSSVEIPRIENLDQIVSMLARYTEKGFGNMGEMGIDIGIDIDGQIWIIEANSDPVKNLSSDVVDIDGEKLVDLILKYYKGDIKDNKILPQLSGVFKYAKFLTKAREK